MFQEQMLQTKQTVSSLKAPWQNSLYKNNNKKLAKQDWHETSCPPLKSYLSSGYAHVFS